MSDTPGSQRRAADSEAGESTRQGTLEELHELLDEFSTAMLVTRSLEGELRARPMAIVAHGDDPESLSFVTDAESAKVDEILERPGALVTMERGARFISLSGKATVETPTTEEIERLWDPTWRLWFPQGPGSANIALLRFKIRYAEYWDRSGLNNARFFWQATKALSEEKRLDGDALPGHGKLDLRGQRGKAGGD